MGATYNEVLVRLREERKRQGLSQNEMARLVHITQIPLYLSLRAAQNHDVFCQPYPAVQIH